MEKHAICLKEYKIRSFLSIRHPHGDLCKHLGVDSNIDQPDRYSNLFLNDQDRNRRAIVALNRSPVLCAPVLFSGR